MYADRSEEAYQILSAVPGLKINRAQGAFYMTALFEEGLLTAKQTLPISDPELRDIVETQASNAALDARFVYYLLASTGICVVPLSGFCSPHSGFRFTLLETDDAKRVWTLQTIAQSARDYLAS